MNETLYYKVKEATEYIKNRLGLEKSPLIGLISGTGLNAITEILTETTYVPYVDIPHFPVSTAPSHKGKLIVGKFYGECLVLMSGRLHYYEGHDIREIAIPIYTMKNLGVERLITTNVSGGLQADMEAGDIVFINDHINLMGVNPLRGKNDERLGVRFPDMKNLYNERWNKKGIQFAEDHKLRAREGVYIGVAGPNLETTAEYNFLHMIGGDCVGMSGIPEMLTAAHAEIDIMVMAVISNVCYPPDKIKKTTIESVLHNTEQVMPKLLLLVEDMIKYFYKDLNKVAE